ncbi:MAG: hypothetical protein R6U96_00860 [Promethearchaeia archaeon]
MDLNSKQTKLILVILLVAGIVLLGLAPVLGKALDKTVIAEETEKEIDADSETDAEKAYTQEISLETNERAIIEFSTSYPNSTATLEIIGKGEFDSEPDDDPSAMTGENFVYSEFAMGDTPNTGVSQDVSSVTIENDDYYYIEFAGDTDGNGNLKSVPGNYVVIVSAGLNETQFDISIKTDGPMDAGDVINTVFNVIGGSLIVAFLAVVSYQLYQRTTEVKA